MALTKIPTAMCPDRKLQWFIDHGWSPEAVEEVWQLVLCHWEASYKLEAVATAPPVTLEHTPIIVSLY
jgi:hypothetical protein